jgi:hypothetical protein|tara:strand:+ start:28 stop:321 length:294 start_codon:yes stop_codon:yes gene_type:complete
MRLIFMKQLLPHHQLAEQSQHLVAGQSILLQVPEHLQFQPAQAGMLIIWLLQVVALAVKVGVEVVELAVIGTATMMKHLEVELRPNQLLLYQLRDIL